MTIIQKLDGVLYHIKTGCEFDSAITFTSIYQSLGEKYPEQIDKSELSRILRKLENDKYIEIRNTDAEIFYYISTDGSYFVEVGGYEQERDEKGRVKNLEKKNFRLTYILVFGTTIAALYYLNELCSKYHWFCFCK